jgi:hypothetical protein
MTYKEKITDIYNLIGQGKAMDAFEKYYHNDCCMVLEDATEVNGKDTNRQREIDFFSSVEEFHGMEITAITADEENARTAVESTMDVTFKGGNRVKIEKVATESWEGDHIVRERVYGTRN